MSRRDEEDRAFIRSIRESPDDDAPRLIYSDWLEDHGDDARAEFIRVQCQLASLPEDDERRPGLVRREAELFRPMENRKRWLGPLFEELNLDHATFRRGFPAELTIRPRSAVRLAEEIDRRVPGARVKPYGGFGDPALKSIAKCPHLDWVTGLEWKYTNLTESGLVILAESECLPRLEAIAITGRFSTAGVQALANSPHRGALRELLLYHSVHDGSDAPESAEAISAPSVGFRLRSLALQRQRIGPGGAKSLAGAAHLGGLTTFDLLLNRIGDEGARELARSPHLRRLTTLNLHLNGLTAEGVRALVDSPILDTVRDLSLGCNEIGDDGAELLARCPRLAGLTRLGLFRAGVNDRGAEALAASPHLSNLESLEMSANGITDAASRALFDSPHLKRLRRIDLSGLWANQTPLGRIEQRRWKARLGRGANV